MKMRIKTYMGNAANPWGIMYMHGGNPSTAAGLFDQNGNRLAWWPAAVEPSADNIELVVTELVWKRGSEEPVKRNQILDLFKGT